MRRTAICNGKSTYLRSGSLGVNCFTLYHLQICGHHILYKSLKAQFSLPSKLFLGLGRISKKQFNLSRAEITGINANKNSRLISSINSNLINSSSLSLPYNCDANFIERLLNKLPHCVCLSSGQNVVISNISLKHHPHSLHIITSMSPITLSINVTKEETLVKSLRDTGNSNCNLTCHEGGTTTRRFVVEKNTVSKVHSISFTVVHQNPEGVLLSDSVWRTGVEGGCLRLGHLLYLSVQLRGGSLVETTSLLKSTSADCIKHTENTNTITVSSVFRHVE
mmetsp:Transcript_6240/g.9112  ORF Transcript_6240/g.9112 Transcript_6240/m.9112 type:complete len:279 (-) Transcript_6240:384-1220(-)